MDSIPARIPWMDAEDEGGLVRSAQRGDRASFLVLARHYQLPVYRVAFALTRDRDQARLLAIDTLVRAWKGIRHYPDGQPFFLWVTRIARNLALSHQRRRPPGSRTVSRARELAEGDTDQNASLALAALERCEQGFAGLSPEHQYALALRLVEGLSYAEIAQALDITVAKAISRISNARAQLLARMGGPAAAA